MLARSGSPCIAGQLPYHQPGLLVLSSVTVSTARSLQLEIYKIVLHYYYSTLHILHIGLIFRVRLTCLGSNCLYDNKQIKLAPTVVKGAQFNKIFCTKIIFSCGVKCDMIPSIWFG